MVKAIMFDLDDTLLWDQKSVEEAFRKTCRLALKKYQIDPSELEFAVREEAVKLYSSYETFPFTQMIGINPFEGLWGDFEDQHEQFQKMAQIVPNYRKDAWTNGLRALGIEDVQLGQEMAEMFPQQRRENPFIYEDTFHVLDQLKGKFKLLLLTNGSPQLQTTKLEITPEIAPYFDHIVISGSFGQGKPAPELFEHAIGLLEVEKEDALMVGDNLMTDILGANRAGIQSVWVNRHQKKTEQVQPTYEIQKLTDLIELLKGIQSRIS